MDNFKNESIFAILMPANNAARDAFGQVAQKKLDDEGWNRIARDNIEINKHPDQVSTYTDARESDGGSGPPKTLRLVLKGCYTFDIAKAPRQPDKGWLIGGGKFSRDEKSPDILLTERKAKSGVSSGHARLAHNFASGALVISALDGNVIWINGHDVVHSQRVIHGLTTSLEFGCLKYTLEVRPYATDERHRHQLRTYKKSHAIQDHEYPCSIPATPAGSNLVSEKYVLKNPIGEGATSVVYAAHNRRNGNAVAIKKIKRTQENAKAIAHDVHVSKHIGEHPRVCHLIDVIDPAANDRNRGYETFGLDEVFLVYMPLASWTIQALIDHDITLDFQTREKMFWQLLEGIGYLHSINVIHRDIKPLNMAVISVTREHPEARLIDFGNAHFGLESNQYRIGTQCYLAPEMWAGMEKRTNDNYNESIDIFAFGLSMYQFFCGQPCGWWDRVDEDADGNINTSTLYLIEFHLTKSKNPTEFMELIASFMDWDPQRRPKASDVLKLRDENQSRSKEEAQRSKSDAETEDDGGGVEI